jgi:hypothetical protein
MMCSSNDPQRRLVQPSPELLQALKAVHEFLSLFKADTMEEDIWRIAFGFINKYENMLTPTERGNAFDMYESLCKAARGMLVVRGELMDEE